jgi:ketosteroid isomerase-like protein
VEQLSQVPGRLKSRGRTVARHRSGVGVNAGIVPLRDNMHMSGPANTRSPVEAFRQFVAAINSHDVETLAALMTADHVFVDSVGNHVKGAISMEVGWRSYFTMCPDYWIQTDDAIAECGTVLAVGEAGGTLDGVAWRTPAAWKAVIRDGTVQEWRVFADNKPVYEILARRKL